MNPESILQATVLDIIFENRNKEYGAYELRADYDTRLKNAIKMMLASVMLICSLLYVDAHFLRQKLAKIVKYDLQDVTISKAVDAKTQAVVHSRQQRGTRKPVSTLPSTMPVIVPDKLADKPLPVVNDVDLKKIGPDEKPGAINDIGPSGPSGGSKGIDSGTKMEPAKPSVLDGAEVMPEFPGGLNALLNFLRKNMRMPKDDLEPGTRINVLEKFVVDENGDISGFSTLQSGGKAFDDEVIRVLKKMPKWMPGKQNGKNVAVYFKLPVIFQSQEDN